MDVHEHVRTLFAIVRMFVIIKVWPTYRKSPSVLLMAKPLGGVLLCIDRPHYKKT